AEMFLEQDVADLVAADKRYEESTKEGLPEGEWNDELLEHYKLQGRLFVNGFYFIDPKGICLARMPWRPGRIGRDFTDRPAIFKIVNQQYRGLLVTEKVDSVREKTPSIALSYGQVKNGELQIITRGIIHMDDFSSRFLKDLPAYSFSVINSSGIVIADTNADHINKDSADVDAHQDVNVIRIPLRYKDAVFILKMVPDIKGLNRTLLRFQLGAYLLFGALGLAFLTGLGLYRNRKQLKDELRERRKAEKKTFLHSEIMKNLSEGIYLMGLDDGIIRYANPKFEAMFGYETGEIIGKHISIVNAPGDKDPEETIRKVIEILGKTGEWHGEVDNIKKDGTLFCCQAHCSVFDHPDYGRVMVTVRTDITERKEMEGRLRQSEKMEAIGRLAGGVAHDFNNQLTGIMGFADLLVSRLGDEKLRKYAENIVRSAKRSAGLTEQLLAFSRKGKYASDPVDIHRIINEVMELLRHSIDKRIILKQHMAASSSIIKGDSTQLQNAFLNLALNACDAMPKGGDLLFSTETVTLDEAWCQKQTFEVVPGKYIRVSVQDSGVGIDPEIQKRIFEPFFTTKTEDRSIGMGLAAVYGTVKHHHGCILVESAPGRGSLFLFYLPLTESSARKGTEVQKTTSAGKAVRI
ncbi:MAG: PAS domain S-box protein, partial [Planctomycetes bacterium]|nr:PAS domain S-box protein [Planctomycetota bacterium]